VYSKSHYLPAPVHNPAIHKLFIWMAGTFFGSWTVNTVVWYSRTCMVPSCTVQ
jgi:hypothetical protein